MAGLVPSARGGRAINLNDLQRAVAAADDAAYLVSPRVLKRVIRRDRGLVFLGQAAHRSTYAIAGSRLGAIVSPDEACPTAARGPWPGTVLLLERPSAEDLAELPPGVLLAIAWRRLYRARVQADVRALFDLGRIDGPGLADRLARIGRAEFDEACLVFRQDGWLLPPETEAESYALFAAHFLELRHLAPALVHPTFPAVEAPAQLEAVFAGDIDGAAVTAATRPAGAPDPATVAPAALPEPESDVASEPEVTEGHDDHHAEADGPVAHDRPRSRRAWDQAGRGNLVRAAILWTQVADESGNEPGAGSRSRSAARSALRSLARRLRVALSSSEREVETWTRALVPLLPRAARGFWTPEARLLYDLQRVCLDHERPSYRIDLLPWLLSLGRWPLKTPLPDVGAVALATGLREALRRLPQIRLVPSERARLESLLRSAVHRAEEGLREQLRPRIAATLASTWVAPGNLPERVALSKLIEELLDHIVQRGHLTLGDLRDAASRSDLKLPDLEGPGDFWRGGRLLLADRALAREFVGVHRRGEVYLRWLQRFSMLAFGTRPGRVFTLFVALPYGSAYVAMEGVHHLVRITGIHLHLVNRWSLLAVGTVLLGVINFVRFRRRFFEAVRQVGRTLRVIVVDLPARLLGDPLVKWLLRSEVIAWASRFALKPALAAVPVWGLAGLCGAGSAGAFVAGAGAFVSASLLLNTRAGRALDEVVIETLTRGWRVVVMEVVPGLFRGVMSAFKRLVEAVERLFYAVDEWLRFRGGQSRESLVIKALVSPVWGAAAYLGRGVLNVLVEPQVNPIKHFPVVTVSHKVMLGLLKPVAAALTPHFGAVTATVITGTAQLVIPGACGFLVWELMSNWRLFASNRPACLQPVVVGGHGETVVRLLRPGVHSGTLPKMFARLRRARRRVWIGLDTPRPDKAAQKQRQVLQHTEEAVRRFVERDLLGLLAGARAQGGPGPVAELGEVRLATGRIRLELLLPTRTGGPPLTIDVEERNRVLVGGVSHAGWLGTLSPGARQTLDDALIGWFVKSGVALVQTPGAPSGGEPTGPVAFPTLSPPARDGNGANAPYTPPLRLADVGLTWSAWVAAWSAPGAVAPSLIPLADGRGVLPEAVAATPIRDRRSSLT